MMRWLTGWLSGFCSAPSSRYNELSAIWFNAYDIHGQRGGSSHQASVLPVQSHRGGGAFPDEGGLGIAPWLFRGALIGS
jgi:hypothetical protein